MLKPGVWAGDEGPRGRLAAPLAADQFGQNMERESSTLSGRYLTALRKYLDRGGLASLQAAPRLGGQAIRLGLEILDLARVHEQAMARLGSSSAPPEMEKRARLFFAEAVTPIERSHPAALQASANLGKINKALDRRTLDLAASHRALRQGIVRRKASEEALEKSGVHSQELLHESRRLQAHLRRLTQRILTSQEGSRAQVSRDLQDEIAQTLLGINVRLLTLKKQGAVNAQSFKKGIANTQRLVDKSVKTVKRFARDFKRPHEA